MSVLALAGATDINDGSVYQLDTYDLGVPDLTDEALALTAMGRDPWTLGIRLHDDAAFSITWRVHGATVNAVNASIDTLITSVFIAGASLTWSEFGPTNAEHCLLRTVSAPLIVHHQTWASVTITGTRAPYFTGAQVDVAAASGTVPCGFSVTGVPGNVPALSQYKVYAAQATERIALGLDTTAGTGWFCDKSGMTDATAYGGAAASATMASAWADLGASADLGAATMEGRYLPFARFNGAATVAANTDLRWRAQIKSSGAGSYVSHVYGPSQDATSSTGSGYEVAMLGQPVTLPPAGVPILGTSWTAATEMISQTAHELHTGDGGPYPWECIAEDFALAGPTKLNTMTVYLAAAAASVWLYATVLAGGKYLPSTPVAPGTYVSGSGTGEYVYSFGNLELAAGHYAVHVDPSEDTYQVGWTNAASAYPSGRAWTNLGGTWYAQDNYDIHFKVNGAVALTFTTAFALQTRCSESSKLGKSDWVGLLPISKGAMVVTRTASANGGVLVDNLADEPHDWGVYYYNSAGDVGASILANAESYGTMLLRPGTNNIVAIADTPDASAPGAVWFACSYIPRWTTPHGNG